MDQTTEHARRLRRGRRLWDLASLTYYGGLERTRATLDELALRHLDPRPGQRILDIGCGTGGTFALLRDAVGEHGAVVGVDFSPRMVARAARRVREAGWPNVSVQRADASRESLGDREFDAALALGAFSAMPDVARAVTIAHEALRPGGRLFVFDMRLVPAGHLGKRMLTKVMRGIYAATAGFTGADVLAELRRTFAVVEPVVPSGEFGTTITIALATKAGAAR